MESPKGENRRDVPKITISLSDAERARLERLAQRWGTKYSRALALAVTHALASLEIGEAIHTVVPSEQRPEEAR
jgi:hypothetical protein